LKQEKSVAIDDGASQAVRPVGSAPAPVNYRQTIIAPSKGWIALDLAELWEFRDLLYYLVWRDLKGRYRQTALGPLWIVLSPLMSMVLYTIIFGAIAHLPSDNQPYAVFTYVALLPWSFFTTAFSSGSNSIASGIGLSSKVYFPRLIVPISQIVSSLVDLGISFVILVGMMFFYRIPATWGVLWIPVWLALAAITGLGVGLWFCGLIVKYRDVANVASFLNRIWMYATPVVYSISVVPARFLNYYWLNPMTVVTEGFRWALLGGNPPPNWTGPVAGLIALPILIAGLYIFKREERNIVDYA
jgi:lipopolysaccharide transport system permease protein